MSENIIIKKYIDNIFLSLYKQFDAAVKLNMIIKYKESENANRIW